jgi:AraC-like DNA-binding protein
MRASVQLLKNLVAGLIPCGVDALRVLEHMGTSWSSVFDADDDDRIPIALLTRFWEAAEAVSGDPCIGVRVGSQARLERFGVLGGAVRASSTLGDALLKTIRYVAFVDESVLLSIAIEGEQGRIAYRCASPEPRHACEIDSIMSTMLVLSRELAGLRLVPTEIRIGHAAPANDAVYRDVFGISPVFAAHEDSVTFRAAALMLPVAAREETSMGGTAFDGHEASKESPPVESFVHKVEALVRAELQGGSPMLENVAAQLGLHAKALTRRLRSEGTTYSAILDRLRRGLAERYLSEPHVSVTDVAFLLGFSDASAFNKASRRWFGTSPRTLRRRLRS